MPSRSRSSSRHNSRSKSKSKSRSKSRSKTPPSRRSRTPDSRRSRSPDTRRSRSPDSRERRRRSPPSRGGGGRRGGNRENPESCNVLGVFGLSLYTSEKDLEKEFGQFGPIEKVQVVLDGHSGRSRGFAFINFESTDDAVEARTKMTGSELDGRKIRVDFSVTKRPHTPTPGMYMGRPTGGRSGYGRDDDRRDRGRGCGRDDDRGGRSYDRRRSPSPYRRRSPSPYRRRSPSPYSRSSRRSRSRSGGRY